MKHLRLTLTTLARRALHTTVVALGAVWLLGAVDAITILLRGGSAAVFAPVHVVLGVAGLLAALAVWPALEVSRAAGWVVQRVAGRLGHAVSVEATPAVLAGVAVAWLLIPAHDEFTIHPAGTWLFSLYAAVPLALVALLVLRLWRGQRERARVARAILIGGAFAFGLGVHHLNSRYLIGLYPPLHRGLTLLSLLAFGGGVWLATATWSARRAGLALGAMAVSMGLALPLGELADARPGVFFLGTELRHVAERLEPVIDGDGDGIPARFGGTDCDDTNPAIHPLAFEVPGNDVDENCRLGPLKGKAKRPLRVAPAVPGMATWRAAHPKPNVVLLFVDTWRWDHFTPELTPNLWRLGQKSAVFTQARTTAPRTPLAWMGILRGRFLGRCLRCRRSLQNPRAESLPRKLQRAGYTNQARLIGKSWKRYHAADGYDRLLTRDRVGMVHGARAAKDLRRMAKTLAKGRTPWFLLGHFADPHAPYKTSPGFEPAEDSMQARYAAEVRYTDHHIGQLLDDLEAQGRMDDTVVIVFADHGENLGEHGDAGGHHGVSLFDEVVRVPLIVYAPGVPGRQVNAPVSLADLGPTILDLTGAQPLRAADGRSLAGYLFGAPPPAAPTISEFYDFDHRLRAIVHGRHKLIDDAHHGVRLLFDIVDDPWETRDLLAAQPEVAAGLQTWLDTWVEHGVDAEERGTQRCKDLVPKPKVGVESLKEKKRRAKAAGKK